MALPTVLRRAVGTVRSRPALVVPGVALAAIEWPLVAGLVVFADSVAEAPLAVTSLRLVAVPVLLLGLAGWTVCPAAYRAPGRPADDRRDWRTLRGPGGPGVVVGVAAALVLVPVAALWVVLPVTVAGVLGQFPARLEALGYAHPVAPVLVASGVAGVALVAGRYVAVLSPPATDAATRRGAVADRLRSLLGRHRTAVRTVGLRAGLVGGAWLAVLGLVAVLHTPAGGDVVPDQFFLANGPGLAVLLLVGVPLVGATRVVALAVTADGRPALRDDRDAGGRAVRDAATRGPGLVGLALVWLLVVGAAAGVAGARVADVDPTATAPGPIAAEEPSTLVPVAVERTRRLDRTVAVDQNTTVRGPEETVRVTGHARYRIDHDDRQLSVRRWGRTPESSWNATRYESDGVVAHRGPARVITNYDSLSPRHRRNGWTVVPSQGYYATARALPEPTVGPNWTVVDRSGGTVTVELTDPERLVRTPLSHLFPGGPNTSYREPPSLRVVVDRGEGYVRAVRASATTETERADGTTRVRRERYAARVTRVGDVDVQRPAAIGDPSIGELAWDAAVYAPQE